MSDVNDFPAVFYGFSFRHHGPHTAFHGLAHALSDQIVVDASPPWPRWVPAPIETRLNWRWLQHSEYRLRPYFRSKTPRVIHYFFPENTLRKGVEWKRHHRLIATCHQPAERIRESEANPYCQGFVEGLRAADRVVVQSAGEVAPLQQFLGHDRFSVIPLGVDTAFFKPGTEVARKQVLTVGNWLRDYRLWAEVVRRVHRDDPEVVFVVVANRDTLALVRAALGSASGPVEYRSGLSDEALRDLYAGSRLLFLPLKATVANDALLEGLASGIPVLASDFPASREYIGPDAGYTLDNASVGAWAETLQRLLHDDSACREMGAAARKRAESLYDWSVVSDQYRDLYRSLA